MTARRPRIIIPDIATTRAYSRRHIQLWEFGMTESTSKTYAANLALYESVLAAVPDVERKGGAVPYTSHNGHMFTYLSKAGVMALRLPEKDREAFLKKYATRLCIQYGTVQKEYVEVPDTLLRKSRRLD
jgi:hypothetical protein